MVSPYYSGSGLSQHLLQERGGKCITLRYLTIELDLLFFLEDIACDRGELNHCLYEARPSINDIGGYRRLLGS